NHTGHMKGAQFVLYQGIRFPADEVEKSFPFVGEYTVGYNNDISHNIFYMKLRDFVQKDKKISTDICQGLLYDYLIKSPACSMTSANPSAFLPPAVAKKAWTPPTHWMYLHSSRTICHAFKPLLSTISLDT